MEAARLDADGLLDNGDVLSITESILARAQNNLITTEETALEIRKNTWSSAGQYSRRPLPDRQQEPVLPYP